MPEVGEYIDAVHFRLLEGFDLPNPTIGERPELLLGRLVIHSGILSACGSKSGTRATEMVASGEPAFGNACQ